MEDSSMYLKGVVARLFSEFDKQPMHLQAEIVEALDVFISAWKIKYQHLRWKPRDHLMASSDHALTESISNVNEHQLSIRSDCDCKDGEKDDYKNEVHNDSEMIISDFWHDAMTDKRGSGLVPLLGFSGSSEETQQPHTMLFISNNLSATDYKVESEIHAATVSASQPQHWTHSSSLDATVELSDSRVPNGALNECNATAADDDGDDEKGKTQDFASFKEEPMKEDGADDGYSNDAEMMADAKPKSKRTRQRVDNGGNWTTRGKRKEKKMNAQQPHPLPPHPHHQQLTVCEICGARVKIIKVHMMQHGERLHTCPYCNYTSHQRGTVDIHIRRLHTNDRPHLCEICGKGFVKSSLLKEHIGVKHNQMKRERSFICSECDFSTYTRTLLDAHTINRHTPYRRQVYKCDKCEAQLCSAHSLKEHVNLCHTNERPFPCSMCDFAAKSAKRLKNHMIYHSEKAFKCETCAKMFYTRPQLRRHQLVHSRKTDFSCPYCSYQCSLAENLRKHCQAIHKVTYPAKKRLNYRREFPKPKQPKETTAQPEETVVHCISLPPVLEMINCSA